ncbi:MAG: 5-oxoprolinase subunit PxpB [Gammaproteobacteria bacterium]
MRVGTPPAESSNTKTCGGKSTTFLGRASGFCDNAGWTALWAAHTGLANRFAANSTAPNNRHIMQDSVKSPQPREKPLGGQADAPSWRWVGERGLRLATGEATLARYAALRKANFPEIEDMIPADDSLLLVVRRGMAVSDALRAALAAPPGALASRVAAVHALPVSFGGEAGPDLAALAARAGLHPDDYVQQVAALEFVVAFVGFQPGFPYLRGLPPALQAPRRATPRARVAAGSVAVGGAYAGIYPAAGPGGWQLIGRTPARLFDPDCAPPALLQPGDRVRWIPA